MQVFFVMASTVPSIKRTQCLLSSLLNWTAQNLWYDS
jgi:hypothetical protein